MSHLKKGLLQKKWEYAKRFQSPTKRSELMKTHGFMKNECLTQNASLQIKISERYIEKNDCVGRKLYQQPKLISKRI